MDNFFSLDNRKKNTKIICNNIILFLNNITNNITNNKRYTFLILILIHYFIVLIPFYFVIFSKIDYKFYISIILVFLIFILHFYFNGCIFIRVERKLLNDKNWYGIWNIIFIPLKYLGFEINSNLINNIFICVGIFIIFFIFIKIIFYEQITLILNLILNYINNFFIIYKK